MPEWSSNPWIIVAVAIGALTLLFAIGRGLIAIGEWIGAVNSDRRAFKTFMEKIEAKLDKIDERIGEIFRRLQPQTVSSASPLKLTDLGRKISEEMKIADWANEQADILVTQTEKEDEPFIYYFSKHHVEVQYETHEEFQKMVKVAAYENGLEIKQIQDVYVLELRDALLARRPFL